MVENSLEEVRELIDRSQNITILTGAGISTDSGIPDFRGPDGMWTKNVDLTSDLYSYLIDETTREESLQFWTDPKLTEAEPNDGHYSLLSIEDKTLKLITQNVDGLHHKSGFNPDKIVEMHGSLRSQHCTQWCGWVADGLSNVDEPCPECGSPRKPSIIFFGEHLDNSNLTQAWEAVHGCGLLLAIGTTLEVSPVCDLVDMAWGEGAKVVIVNNAPTSKDSLASHIIRESISEILPKILGEVPL